MHDHATFFQQMTPAMLDAIAKVQGEHGSARELGVDSLTMKRIAALGLAEIDPGNPPFYSLSPAGVALSQVLNAPLAIPASDPEGTVARIKRLTCEQFRVNPSEMTSQRRAADIARPRQVAMYLACRHSRFALSAIGRMFGERDHTTVSYARDRIEALRATDASLNAHIEAIEAQLHPEGVE